MKLYLKIIGIFVAGLAVGIVIMGYLSMRASRTFLEVFREKYYVEQNDLQLKHTRQEIKTMNLFTERTS